MNELFYIDKLTDISVTYKQLVDDICETKDYGVFCKSDNYYVVFKNIIISLILGKEIILFDSDFSENEVSTLIGNIDIHKTEKLPVGCFSNISVENLIQKIQNNSKNWSLEIFTSGTTGVPKKIRHNFESLTRQIKISASYKDNVWGFAYNPTHMAGLQVFFQALLNKNTMIRLFQLSKDNIIDQIKKQAITNISATPTFYRLLLPCSETFSFVQRITLGGEKLSNNVLVQLKVIFPNAIITNVYASTEAGALFASNGEFFEVKEYLKDFVMIENGELLIHKSLMSSSVDSMLKGEWYHTGDLVEIKETIPVLKFRFISRKNEMINIGGYKVNPSEVEDIICQNEKVISAQVFAKENSVLGSILCAKIVSNNDLTEVEVRQYLKGKLQEFKIPRIINFVSKIETTRTGKIQRHI